MCTYFDQTVLDVEFALLGDESRSFGPYPTGTQCVVAEIDDAGATTSQLEPADGLVTISDTVPATVTATNVFDVTSVIVTKKMVGTPPATTDLTFTVSLSCTVERMGSSVPVLIPGGATRELVAPDQLSATYADLSTDATCTITETERAGADVTSINIDGVTVRSSTST